jgi:hypothetical protein
LEKYRRLGRKLRNILRRRAKSWIETNGGSVTVDTGDFTALDRSASLREAYGAASFDKFSTQKRRAEKTAKWALGE